MNSSDDSKTLLRRELRDKRAKVSPAAQKIATKKISQNVASHPLFESASSIAFYIANDGEISPNMLIELARKLDKRVYLPAITSNKKLLFRDFSNPEKITKNRFGITEPDPSCDTIDASELDIVFLPLVAFDKRGNRLGMGGGYYDRTFAYRANNPSQKPALIGLAHAFQEVKKIAAEKWDVALDHICTDEDFIKIE